MMIAFVYPGQGSQKRGMGSGQFDDVDEFVTVEKEVDAIRLRPHPWLR